MCTNLSTCGVRWVPVGKVDRLFIYPVKSARGVEVKRAVVRSRTSMNGCFFVCVCPGTS